MSKQAKSPDLMKVSESVDVFAECLASSTRMSAQRDDWRNEFPKLSQQLVVSSIRATCKPLTNQ